MDYHLERGLRLYIDPDRNALYQWAISEVDAKGQQIGGHQIPWAWTLRFTATSCVLGDSIDIRPQHLADDTKPAPSEIKKRQIVQLKLRPGSARDDGDYQRETTFSMFGTNRAIKSFQLDIHPITDQAEQESCAAWGCVSYTAETDFRNETAEDCIIFYMFVKPDAFARYAAKISHSAVDEMVLSVGLVDGFYSEWSPSISTRDVKVLATGDEQKITLPPGLHFKPPRLGKVGEAALYINRRLEFGKRKTDDPVAVVEVGDVGTVRVVPEMQAPAALDTRTLKVLGSLKRAAWFMVLLLALILVAIASNISGH